MGPRQLLLLVASNQVLLDLAKEVLTPALPPDWTVADYETKELATDAVTLRENYPAVVVMLNNQDQNDQLLARLMKNMPRTWFGVIVPPRGMVLHGSVDMTVLRDDDDPGATQAAVEEILQGLALRFEFSTVACGG